MSDDKIRWGMPTLIECADAEANIRLCRKLGLQFVELNMNLPMFQADRLDALRSLSERYEVGFTIHLDENFNPADFNPLIRDAWLETLKRSIDAAKGLDAGVLNMHLTQGAYFTLPDRREYLFGKYRDEYMRSMRHLRDFCEQALEGSDIRICIENTDGFTEYQREALEMLLESECFGLTWDIGHSHTAQKMDEPFLLAHSDRLRHFHIHDASTGCHMELGTGEVDLQEKLSLALSRRAACVLETKTIAALESSVRWLGEFGWMLKKTC